MHIVTTARLICLQVHCDRLPEIIKDSYYIKDYQQRKYFIFAVQYSDSICPKVSASDGCHGFNVSPPQHIY